MSSRSNLEVVACVTAFNEEATVGEVLDVLLRCESVDRVQVVNDGSTDGTREVCESRKTVRSINLAKRVPVGEAIMHHLDDLDEECILLWCDADLIDFRPEYMDALVRRFREEGVSMSMSSRGLPRSWPGGMRWPIFKKAWAAAFGPISGERAILRSEFLEAIELSRTLGWPEMMRGYGIVLFLNYHAKKFGNGCVIEYFDQLRQRQKYEKWGKISIFEMWGQWLQFYAAWLKIRLNAGRIRRHRSQLVESRSARPQPVAAPAAAAAES